MNDVCNRCGKFGARGKCKSGKRHVYNGLPHGYYVLTPESLMNMFARFNGYSHVHTTYAPTSKDSGGWTTYGTAEMTNHNTTNP